MARNEKKNRLELGLDLWRYFSWPEMKKKSRLELGFD